MKTKIGPETYYVEMYMYGETYSSNDEEQVLRRKGNCETLC